MHNFANTPVLSGEKHKLQQMQQQHSCRAVHVVTHLEADSWSSICRFCRLSCMRWKVPSGPMPMAMLKLSPWMVTAISSGSRLTPLTPMMPNGNPRSMKIVGGGYCSNTRYEESCKKREHSIEHWRKLSRTMATMLPLCLLS